MTERNTARDSARYFTGRTVEALSLMKLSKKAGLFPKSEGWRNVVEHMVVEAEAADVLGEILGLPLEDRENLRTATLLHDVFKRKEIEKAKEVGPAGFDSSVHDQSDWIRSFGYSEEIVRLTESVGHSSLVEFTRDFDSIPTIRRIMHYVDDITLRNNVVPLDKRMAYLENNPGYASLNEEGRKFFGKPYFEVQREVSKRIEQELAGRLGIDDAASLPLVLQGRICERIDESARRYRESQRLKGIS